MWMVVYRSDECYGELSEALPSLEAVLTALNTLKMSDREKERDKENVCGW